MATLTAANSVYYLVITSLYPTPQRLEGYAADDVFSTEAVDSAEVVQGVDGKLSAGWVPTMKRQTITLQADSASSLMFDVWFASQDAAKDLFTAQAEITLPSLGRIYTCLNGYLTNYMPMPDARRIMQPRRFQITWENILGASI